MTRKERETMINCLIELGKIPTSWVVRKFDTEQEAIDYKNKIEASDKIIDNLLDN